MAVVIGLGMDYTDSGRGLGRVAGVRSIAGGLEAA
jgi:hypoxanthine-guanine phosphoribosyltransferase